MTFVIGIIADRWVDPTGPSQCLNSSVFSYEECIQTVVKQNLDLGMCLNGSRWRLHHQTSEKRTLKGHLRPKRSLPGFCGKACRRERMAYPMKLVKRYIEIKYSTIVDYVLPDYIGKNRSCYINKQFNQQMFRYDLRQARSWHWTVHGTLQGKSRPVATSMHPNGLRTA